MSVNSVLARFVEIEAKYGSLTRGVLAAPRPKGAGSGSLFRTLKNGLGQLVDALRGSADIVHGEVESVERTGAGFRARVAGDWIDADHVVLATPAGDAARLLQPWNGKSRESSRSHPVHLFDHAIARLSQGHVRSSTQRIRIPGAQARAQTDGRLHLGGQQVQLSRAGRHGAAALFHGRRRARGEPTNRW